ncbi:MAG: hypothetical protein J2P36_10540 [Ktedonobacteraceae bacterium]|nr:hypothetical protein [Ktedonobacteraceae bacterium]
MIARVSRGFWKWSLVAAAVAWGTLYALDRTDLSRLFIQPSTYYFIGLGGHEGPATVVSTMIQHTNWIWLACQMGVALLIYVIVGWWATQRTGRMRNGMLAGLWAGLFFGLISFIENSIDFLWFAHSLSSIPAPYSDFSQPNVFVEQLTLFGGSFLMSFLPLGLFAGIIGGLLGMSFSVLSGKLQSS